MKTTLVTCSYGPDAKRCEAMCASVDQYVDSRMEHVLIVPRRDAGLFDKFVGERRRLVFAEDVLPAGMRRVPFNERWWVTPFSPPVRGWIVQQISKLSVPLADDSDAWVFVDSDIIFIRPFGPEQVWEGRAIRFYRTPGKSNLPGHRRWHRTAGQLLGLETSDYYGSDYIGPLVSWRRDDLLALHKQLEKVSGKHWQRVLCRTLHFSEYILYGVFVDHVLEDRTRHAPTSQDLCHCSFYYDLDDPTERKQFITGLQPHHVAVLVQSHLGVDMQQQQAYVQAVLKGSSGQEALGP